METANRNHANRPTPITASDRARLARNVPSPRRDTDRLVNFGIVFVSLAAMALAVMP